MSPDTFNLIRDGCHIEAAQLFNQSCDPGGIWRDRSSYIRRGDAEIRPGFLHWKNYMTFRPCEE